jgi:hypothetical protein
MVQPWRIRDAVICRSGRQGRPREDLKKRFDVTIGIVWGRTVDRVKAVEGVSFAQWQG